MQIGLTLGHNSDPPSGDQTYYIVVMFCLASSSITRDRFLFYFSIVKKL